MATDQRQHTQALERLDNGRQRFHGCSRIQDYEYMCKLGEGTFGEVSKARSKKTGQVVALKKILMHNEKDGFPITAIREIKLLKQLDHVNVLKLEEMAVERPKNAAKKTSMFMVTPYMDHDLSGLLENPSVRFTEPQIKCYMKQLLEGCRYLHENRILHRDMKAANLLINNRGILQIADFGLARPYDDEPPKPGQGGGDATREYTTLVVTRWYRPPELLLQLRKYTTAIDMWGVGCVFGEMFKGKPILAGNSDLDQSQIIFDLVGSPNDESMPGWQHLPGIEGGAVTFIERRGQLRNIFKDQSDLAISLLSELLKLDWRKRLNAIDALEHPYFHTPPLPARPGDLPSFEESHELDRRKFRDQKNKPPPAPAGGAVGVGPQGEWGINGKPFPQDGRGPRGPHGRPYQNGHLPPYGRRPLDRNGRRDDYRHPPRDMPPRRNDYDAPPRIPPVEQYNRPPDVDLPARPPPVALDPYTDRRSQNRQPYRDDDRGPPPRQRPPPDRRPPPIGNDDTFIPSYSSAHPNNRNRDDRPRYPDGRRGSQDSIGSRGNLRYEDRPPPRFDDRRRPPDYDDPPLRYDERPRFNEGRRGSRDFDEPPLRDPPPVRDGPPMRNRPPIRYDDEPPPRGRNPDSPNMGGGYNRRRSRSPREYDRMDSRRNRGYPPPADYRR